jgi:diguanylate cyclase (GGDEF)-like protein
MRTISGLPARLFAYITFTTVTAAALLGWAICSLIVDPPGWRSAWPVLFFAALSLAADLRPVPMDESGKDQVSVASVFTVTTAVLFGARYAIPVAALSIAVPAVVTRQPWEKFCFNVSMYILTSAGAALPVVIFGTPDHSGIKLSGYVLFGGAVHLLTNVALLAGVISLSQRIRFFKTVLPGLRHGGAAFAIMIFLAALAANLWLLNPLLLVLLAGPLFTVTLYQRTALNSRIAARDAQTDHLTLLGNHRAYQASLHEHVVDSERTRKPFALCLIDVDNFKQVNDTYGHPVGDDVLAKLAELLSESDDVQAFRFGGDEFAVLVDLDEMGAYRVLEDVQRRLATLDLCPDGITISVGIASYPAHAVSADELQRTADGALYWSKQHGKNRSCLYSPSVVRIYSREELQRETERAALLHAAKNLVRFVDARDSSTANHSQIVSTLAETIGLELELGAAMVDQLRLAGLLHDLGKVGIPDSILTAPRPLEPEEYEIVKRHPEIGHSLLEGLELAPVDDWILHHHEWWDGSGYPHGLAGEEIPLGSRIVLVADAFEAITADRPYRPAQSQQAALRELRRAAGTQFDPDVVAALERALGAATTLRILAEASA